MLHISQPGRVGLLMKVHFGHDQPACRDMQEMQKLGKMLWREGRQGGRMQGEHVPFPSTSQTGRKGGPGAGRAG